MVRAVSACLRCFLPVGASRLAAPTRSPWHVLGPEAVDL